MNEEAMVFLRVSILGIVPELWLELASIWMLAQGYELVGLFCSLVGLFWQWCSSRLYMDARSLSSGSNSPLYGC